MVRLKRAINVWMEDSRKSLMCRNSPSSECILHFRHACKVFNQSDPVCATQLTFDNHFNAKLQTFRISCFQLSGKTSKLQKKKKKKEKKLDLKNIGGNIRVCLNMALPVAATLSCNIKLKKINDYFQ